MVSNILKMPKINFYEGLDLEPGNVKWLKGLALFQIVGGLFVLIWAFLVYSEYLSNVASFIFASLSVNAGYLLWRRNPWGYVMSMINFVLQSVAVDFYGWVYDYTLTGTVCGYFSLAGTIGYRASFNPGVELRNIGTGDEMILVIEVIPLILIYLLHSKIYDSKEYKGY